MSYAKEKEIVVDPSVESTRGFLRELSAIVNTSESSESESESDSEDDPLEAKLKKSDKAIKRIEEILKEHKSQAKTERAAFLGLDNMEDVFVEVDRRARADDQVIAADLYRKMLDAYNNVERRRSELFAQLRDVFPGSLLEKETTIYESGRSLASDIRGVNGPLTSDFEAQREKLAKRLATLAASKEEKIKIREEVEKERKEKQGKEREDFKNLLEKVGTRAFERMDSFDPFIVAADPDDAKILFKQFEAARERYLKVLDTGGNTAEAEQQLSHIPKCWWPPAFVKEVQAWRAIERRRRDDAVKKIFEESKKGEKESSEGESEEEGGPVKSIDNALDMLSSATSSIAKQKDKFGHVGIAPEEAERLAKLLNEVTTALKVLQSATPGVDFAMEFSEFKEKNTTDKVEQVAGAVADFGEKVEGVFSAAEQISEAAKEFAEQFIGPLVIASGVAKFVQGCAQMKKFGDNMKNTANLIDRVEIEMVLGEREDGGALVRSMENSRTDQKIKLAKTAIDTVDASLQVVEGAVDTAGQTHAKYGVVIARKVITLGSKVAFAEVDFRSSRQAMRTLNDARAGSMVAQVQIFEDSTYYAMSYIAVLVEQGDPIADSFARRAVTDSDVKKKEFSTAVLAEFLQKAAGNFDVDQGSETRTEAIGKKLKSGYEAMAEKWDAFADKYFPAELPGSTGTEYDPKWKHTATDVVLSEGNWLAARRRAISEAGMFDNDEKIPDGFLAAAEAFRSLGIEDESQFTAQGLQTAASKAKEPSNALRNKDVVMKAVVSLTKCSSAIQKYDAWHTPYGEQQKVGPHAGYVAYQMELSHEVTRCQNFLDVKVSEAGWLTGSDPRDFGWKPPKAVFLEGASFQRYWTEACKQAWLPDEPPGGVVNALNQVSGAELATKGREKEASSAARDANKHFFDMLIALTKEIDKAWPNCQHPGLKEYMLAMKLEAAKRARVLDQTLNELPSFTIKNADFTAAAWKQTYEDARSRGAADKVDDLSKNLISAFETWSKAEAKMLSNKVPDQILGRTDGLTALKDVNKHAVAAGLKIGSPKMSEHCANLAAIAKQKLQQLDQENNQNTFAWRGQIVSDPKVWTTVYAAAVSGGVVVENKSAAETVKKTLEQVAKLNEQLRDGNASPKSHRKTATELLEAIGKADNAVRILKEDKGHRNQNFQEMISNLVTRVEWFGNQTLLTSVLAGSRGGPFKPAKPKDFNRLNWDGSDGAQSKAVEAGILENDKDDSFGNAIGNAYTYDNLFGMQARGTNISPKEIIETKRKAREAMEHLKKAAAAQQKAIENDDYNEYMQAWIDVAEQRMKRLGEREEFKDVGEFSPPRFVYSDDNWQKAKAQAVGMGILEDVRTNVGKFLTESSEKYDAYEKLRKQTTGVNPEELEKARSEAITKIRQAMGAVSQVRKLATVKNDKWEAYLNQAVQAIQTRYDECARKSVTMTTFDMTLSREPTILDWQRAIELAAKLQLTTGTGDAFGSLISDADTKCSLFLQMCHEIGIQAKSASEAKDAALESLVKLRNGAGTERSKIQDSGFQKYVDQWTDFANRRTELVNKRFTANFT